MNLTENSPETICLITPPSPFLLDERVFMHIGILKVASSLESRGHKVEFLDLSGIDNYLKVVEDYCKSSNIKTFGLTASTPQVPFAVLISKAIRKHKPSAKIILGGPHVTLMNTACKREVKRGLDKSNRATEDISKLASLFDVLVCGDGELTIFEALKINRGIVDADDRKSPFFLSNQQFSDLPLPARHLLDVDSYRYTIEGKKSVSLIAQLGCPFKCAFCSGRNSPFLRKIRQRSTDSIIEEMRLLYHQYGFTGFMFYDDELNVNKSLIELLNKITDLQHEVGEEFRLRGFVKAELFNDAQAEAMYRAGFRWLLTGFESGDERILRNIRKMATRDDNTRAVEIAKKHNLKVKALMSIGHAGESYESVENTKNWLLEAQPEEFDCTIITTYPGSPYFDDAVKQDGIYVYTDSKSGDKLYQSSIDYLSELDYYKGDPDGGYVSYVWTDNLQPKELVAARDDLENEVRQKLNIQFNPARPAQKYEHSMGMGNIKIPDHILRTSKG
jgi:anaerobic magnesium-protoporphyrin IX monomethyl ester cyclase